MSGVPIVDPTKVQIPEAARTIHEDPNPDGCKKHCHYPTIQTGRYSAGNDISRGCPCMEDRRDCDFEWDDTGRGFCRNCHHASSVTVKASDCRLDF